VTAMPAWTRAAVGFCGLLLVWQAIVLSGWVPQTYVPGVPAIAAALVGLLRDPAFWHHEALSLARAFGGLAFATLTGTRVALLAARHAVVARALAPIVQVMLSLPPAALVPLSIFALGLGWELFAFIVWFAAFWTVYAGANNALRASEPVQLQVARALGYGPWETLLKVRLPAATPEIFTAIRIAGAGCLMATVAAEMLAGRNGLGFLLYDAAFSLQTPTMFALLVVAGANGVLMNRVVLASRGRVAGWHDRLSEMARA
jgi:NitT/TauT family transport system permease protein